MPIEDLASQQQLLHGFPTKHNAARFILVLKTGQRNRLKRSLWKVDRDEQCCQLDLIEFLMRRTI